MNPITVLLADNNASFLRVVNKFLAQHDEIEVVGTAEGGREALVEAKRLQPQVMLVDLGMPDLSGLDAIPLLREAHPEMFIIALTLLDTDSYREAALAAGADAFIPKATLNANLMPAIRRLTGEMVNGG